MNKELFVSSTPHETRLAVTEDGEVVEVYFEREKEYSLAGSIYKGRVTRVLPGMQSAFVDIGLDRDAFLYVSDFFEDSDEYERVVGEAEAAAAKIETPRGHERQRPGPAAREEDQSLAPTGADGAADSSREVALSALAEPLENRPTDEAAPRPQKAPTPPQEFSQGEGYGRHRRGRRRGRRRGNFPESKFARSDREAPAGAPVEHRTEPPASTPASYPMILPGESLAKYRNVPPAGVAAASPLNPPTEEQLVANAAAEELTDSYDDDFESSAVAAVAEESAAGETVDEPEYEKERFQPDSPSEAEAGRGETAHTSLNEPEKYGWKDSEQPAPEREFKVESQENTPAQTEQAWQEPALASDEADEEYVEDSGVPYDAPEGGVDEPVSAAEDAGHAEPEPADSAAMRQAPANPRFEARARRRRRRRRGGVGPLPAHVAPALAGAVEASRASEPPAEYRGARPQRLIGDLLREGQEILVQIAKEPLGKKGARITSHLALPGRFLVYMPTVNHIGVSRKIGSDEERARLKRLILENSRDLPGGFIIRTAGQSASESDFKADIRYLSHLWAELREQFEHSKAPALLHHDLNLVERTLRDQLSDEFTHIWVDSEEQYQRVVRFVNYFMPHLINRVRLYTRDEPLFEHFKIQDEINKALRSKVWIKSGGYIVINQTEALVAIDVNTGKYVGKSNRLEDTIFKTNVDAIQEIVRQIRLRDLGGIIVIDFIDMDERRNRQKVMQALEEAMRADRAPSKLLSFNDFGLVALTRKRVKQSLERTLGTPCPYCTGTGLVKSVVTVCNEIYGEVRKLARTLDRDDVVLRVNPEVAKALKSRSAALLVEMEELTGKAISVQADASVHQERFEIF